MSNAFALQLPKFDPEPGSVVGDGDLPFGSGVDELGSLSAMGDLESDFPDLGGDLPAESTPLADFDDDDHWVPEPDPSETLIEERLEATEKLVTELASTIQLVQGQMFERVEQKIQVIAAALFPKLAEEFLADEIARFLAYAAPQNRSQIEIAVPAPIVAEVTEALLKVKSIHNRWTIETAPESSGPMVQVNWGDGGFDYDLSTLLAACHAQNFQNGHEAEE